MYYNDAIFSLLITNYRVSRKSLDKEKFKYLCHSLTKWADILPTGRKVFIVHIDTRNVVKNCFEVFTIDFSKELDLFSSYEKNNRYISFPKDKQHIIFRLILYASVIGPHTYTIDTCLVTQCTLKASVINSKNLLTKLQY